MIAVLLGLRFLLELALVVTAGFLGYQLSDDAVVRVLLAVALPAVTIVIWGLLLSPRRRVELSLPGRAAIEVVLFVTASAGLVWAGYAVWGWTLLLVEIAVLAGLWSLGLPPGSDVGAPRADAR